MLKNKFIIKNITVDKNKINYECEEKMEELKNDKNINFD